LKFEIYRAFFIAFGAIQTVLNLIYLLKSDGPELARKQHREIPAKATSRQMRTKALCMFLIGTLFLATGLISSFIYAFHWLGFPIALGVYAAYALVEAAYYRFWRTTGAFVITCLLLLVYLLF
jgi:hypothetical protein